MGNDQHQAKEVTLLKFQDKCHTFIIVPNEFPLPEDGIIGIPVLHAYQFNLSNKNLQLDNRVYPLECYGIIIPKNSIKMITLKMSRREGHVIIENNPYIPDSIYRISNSQILVPIVNDTENELRLSDDNINFEFVTSPPERKEQINYITHEELTARLKLLTENLRLQHIEESNRGAIKKIATSYHDIFTLPGDALPSTSLASHKIVLKEDKIINLRQPRHPECHREEVTNQVNEMLIKKIIAESDITRIWSHCFSDYA